MAHTALDGDQPPPGDQFFQRHLNHGIMNFDPVRAKPPLCDALGRIFGIGMRAEISE